MVEPDGRGKRVERPSFPLGTTLTARNQAVNLIPQTLARTALASSGSRTAMIGLRAEQTSKPSEVRPSWSERALRQS